MRGTSALAATGVLHCMKVWSGRPARRGQLLCSNLHKNLGAQDWGDELFDALKAAGGTAFSNYAVGYNNVRPIVPSSMSSVSDNPSVTLFMPASPRKGNASWLTCRWT